MSGGIRTNCRKCYTKLRKNKVCPKCNWSYEKEFQGQTTLEDKENKRK